MAEALELRVSLEDVQPEIWRQIIVPGSLTLRELHAVIQGAMGWQDSHLHMFEIKGSRFEVPPDDDEAPWLDDDEALDERESVLSKLVAKKGMRFTYVYDFGDNWEHSIQVTRVLRESEVSMPVCLSGEMACPPEDSGGAPGYMEFLAVRANPRHPEHKETVEWAGSYSPDHFNVTQANALIAVTCALYAERGWGFADMFGR